MKNKAIALIALCLAIGIATMKGEDVVVKNDVAHPVPVGIGTSLTSHPTASHITTKTTTTLTSATALISSIAICVTNAGTTQTLVIQDKTPSTPKILYTAGAAIAVGNTYIIFPAPVLMTGGIDIVTAGTTA